MRKPIVNKADIGKEYLGKRYTAWLTIPNISFDEWKTLIDEWKSSPFQTFSQFLRAKLKVKVEFTLTSKANDGIVTN